MTSEQYEITNLCSLYIIGIAQTINQCQVKLQPSHDTNQTFSMSQNWKGLAESSSQRAKQYSNK
jgi:hypothetical protein